MNIQQFVNRHWITMQSRQTEAPKDSDWHEGATHWACTLRKGSRQLTVEFHMGSALRGDPDVCAVLDCLASDASAFINSDDFESFADEMGYDSDSRKAEGIYRACKKVAAQLDRFLGSDDLRFLMYEVERM